MTGKPLILLGSSRKAGDTSQLVANLFPEGSATVVDLLDYTISHYRYDGLYSEKDDFLLLVELLLQHRQLVFATPVYWYAMSGLLKVFFDRLTDLVTVHKDIGRKMKGKQTFLLAVGAEEKLPWGFEEPFRLTSTYFGMEFIACLYRRTAEINVKGNTDVDFLRYFPGTDNKP